MLDFTELQEQSDLASALINVVRTAMGIPDYVGVQVYPHRSGIVQVRVITIWMDLC